MEYAERVERDVRALTYIIDEKPYLQIRSRGRFKSIEYNVANGTKRGFRLFRKAVWLFTKTAWQELS